VYSSERITKIGQYLPELSQKLNVSRFLWPTVYILLLSAVSAG